MCKFLQSKHGLYLTVSFLTLLLFLVNGLVFKNINILIKQGTSGYYQFNTCLEFVVSNAKLKYFDPEEAKNCKLCNFTSINDISDSTKKDVIISFSILKTHNLALLQRTLRTTKSNASLVLLLDQQAIDSLDEITKQFFKNCSTQVVIMPVEVFQSHDASPKNFMIPLMYLFLKMNRHLINRVIFVDLFDTVFQSDPFSSKFIRRGEIHIVREVITNMQHVGNINWPRCYFPNFKWNDPNGFQLNSGYYGGYIDDILVFLNVFCQYTRYNRCHDQAFVNIMYNWHMLDKYHVKFADVFEDERVLQLFAHTKLDRGFPYCQGNYWKNVTASVIHLYYHANKNFHRSLLKHCPRLSKTMRSYLSKTKNIEELEADLDKWDQNSETVFY